MNQTNDNDEEAGPEMSMEGCLYAGLSYADFQWDDVDEKSRAIIEKVGELVVGYHTSLVVQPHLRDLAETLAHNVSTNPWFRFGVEYKLGHSGTYRVMESFERFRNILPIYAAQQVSPKSQRYLSEAVGCYLLGFDAACIVFCRSTVETLLKEGLQAAGHPLYQDLASAPTAGKVIEDAYSRGLIRRTLDVAKRLKKTADHTLHRAPPDEKILPQQAVDSIRDMTAVLEELLS